MILGTIDRVIIREVLKLLLIYSGGFLVLFAIAISAPLVNRGAPLWDVLLFLPNQLVFPAILAIPLALITALLSTLARMREDGEVIALMASGVNPLRFCYATAPIVLASSFLVLVLSHVVMPAAFQNYDREKGRLIRQAMATTVARQEPIYQIHTRDQQVTLAAHSAAGATLEHVFAWRTDEHGRLFVGYAPRAEWSYAQDHEHGQTHDLLGLNLIDVRTLGFTPDHIFHGTRSDTTTSAIIAGTLPYWSLALQQDTGGGRMRPDATPSPTLRREIRKLKAENGSDSRLRRLQLAYHLRWLVAGGIPAWWLFATGIALTVPARSRLVAIVIGLFTVTGSILPAIGIVRGMRGHLAIHPSIILWSPLILVALIGILMIWRRTR
ncbi:MAG: LptF/LptG family permease [Planctomycetota bacterium]|nr:MAG: LptF/LptG family permease [Planctomycetota bacterium]